MNYTSICYSRANPFKRNKVISYLGVRSLSSWLSVVLWFSGGFWLYPAFAQSPLPLDDLSAFQEPGPSWQIAGDVNADLQEDGVLHTSKGKGILVNLPDKKKPGKDLYTQLQHGDVDLELDYMMAKGSNSGIYLQGRYEIQLLDSWGVTHPRAGDNGGIYERWDESQPEGQKGYEGYAPRQNVSRAPGLWQHLKISFQAPRFDTQGNKTEDAHILSVELSGVTIHENVALSGPTRGAMVNNEVAQGPLRIQGDHGAIAFRNMVITPFDKPRPELSDLQYAVYQGDFQDVPDFSTLQPEATGTSEQLTSTVSPLNNEFLLRYQGKLTIKEAGEYNFQMEMPGGGGLLKINDETVIPVSGQRGRGAISLPAGEVPIEVIYSKVYGWIKPSFMLSAEGPGIRRYEMTSDYVDTDEVPNPILVHAPDNTILRSFMDVPNAPRVVHAVSVGSPQKVHYTYDMDHGMLVQLWRGDFLNATPMWHNRGNGTSRPIGSVQALGKPMLAIARLSSAQQAWVTDSAQAAYRPKGYVLDDHDLPVFRYQIYGTTVKDAIRVLEGGHGVHRVLEVEQPASNLYARLAEGKSIEAVSDGLYLIDDKAYYIQMDNAANVKPLIRDGEGGKELIVPVQTQLSYSILF